jgi:hypothetical protein
MTKLIRKYNKWLLAVLGSFLMVAFLVSSVPSFGQGGDPGKRVEATLGKTKVRARDLGNASRDFNFIASILPGAVENLNIESVPHWYLLAHEAKAQGLVGTATDGDAWLEEVANQMIPMVAARRAAEDFAKTSGMSADNILRIVSQNQQLQQQFAQRWLSEPANREAAEALPAQILTDLRETRTILAGKSGLSVEEANSTLATLRGVMRLYNSAQSSNRFSDKRAQFTLQQEQDAVLADVVIIPPTALTITTEPTPALLSQLFEAGKDKQPDFATGTFGYTQPNRVQLQWFVVSRASFEASIRLDSVQTRIEFEKNRAKYPGEFATERPRIEQEIRTRKLNDALATAEQTFRTQVRVNTRSLPSDGATKVLPPDWRASAPALNDYAAKVAEAIGLNDKLSMSAPQIQSRSTWVRVDRLSELPVIGTASIMQAGKPMGLSELLANLREFDAKTLLELQVGVPYPSPLRTNEGDLVFFVVTDSKAASPAETLDEVRADVVADAKKVMAFDELKAKAQEWKALAAANGLDDFVAKFSAGSLTGSTPPESLSVQRQQRFAAGESTMTDGLGREPLRDSVLALANSRGRLVAATDADRAARTTVAELPATRSIAIAQIVGDSPVTLEDFRGYGAGIGQALARNERSKIAEASATATASAAANARSANANSPFSFESLSKRLGYKPVSENEKEAKKESEKAEAPAAPKP